MYVGYNTNGLAFHQPIDAIELLHESGYEGIAFTIDHGLLSPRDAHWKKQAHELRTKLINYGMRCVIETGARFLLDFRVKHEPTLVTCDVAGRDLRVKFLEHAIDVASEMQSDCVSCWSGILRDDPSREKAMERLADGLRRVLDYAHHKNVAIAFEPEPGMFIATMQDFDELLSEVDAPHLKLTMDIGHLHCQDELPIAAYIHRWQTRLANVHIEDMRAGVHEHLMFGEGEIDFLPVIQALDSIRYQGGLYVELSRHSHDAPQAVRRSRSFLQALL